MIVAFLLFVDVKAKECVEHVSDKEEVMEVDRTMHGSTMTTLHVLVTLWTMICVSNFLLYFYLCPKISVSKFFAMPPSIQFSNLIEF